jgi:hypothetical protein
MAHISGRPGDNIQRATSTGPTSYCQRAALTALRVWSLAADSRRDIWRIDAAGHRRQPFTATRLRPAVGVRSSS